MTNQRHLVFLLLAILLQSVHSEPASKLDEIFTHLRARLDLASDIALIKLKTCKLIEDQTREGEILAKATSEGTKQGLTKEQVETFYKAQMEANKMIQYNVIALNKTLSSASPKNNLAQIRTQINELDAKILLLIKPAVTELQSSNSSQVCLEAVAKVVAGDPQKADYYKVAVVRSAALFTDTCLTAPTCKAEDPK
ncbi:hypothetical protein WDU94_015504 [Cyamophila willieti]